VASQIRDKLSRFVKYCRTHRTFTIRMIELSLNIPYSDLENDKIRSASFAINDVLNN
jgi:hypothetical protein